MVVQGTVTIYALIVAVMSLVVDVAYPLGDPRVKC